MLVNIITIPLNKIIENKYFTLCLFENIWKSQSKLNGVFIYILFN